jgi:hypothetical protein
MVIEVLPNMVDKTKEIFVIPTLAFCINCTCSFDLWMSCANFDIFAIVTSRKPPFLTKSFQLHDICNYVSIGFLKF